MSNMTQDELWLAKWQEVIDFMETYHRNPSKHRIEEHLMLNWIKHNRKLMNAGRMKEERVKLFRELRIPADTRSVIPVIPVHSGCEIFN